MVVTIIIEHCDEGQSPVTVSPQPSALSHHTSAISVIQVPVTHVFILIR